MADGIDIFNTPDELVTHLVTSGFVENYFKKISFSTDRANFDDELCEFYLMISEQKDSIFSLYKEGGIDRARRYVSGLIYRNIHSTRSTIYYKYKRHLEKLVDISQYTE